MELGWSLKRNLIAHLELFVHAPQVCDGSDILNGHQTKNKMMTLALFMKLLSAIRTLP
jgi:hypothetical protein